MDEWMNVYHWFRCCVSVWVFFRFLVYIYIVYYFYGMSPYAPFLYTSLVYTVYCVCECSCLCVSPTSKVGYTGIKKNMSKYACSIAPLERRWLPLSWQTQINTVFLNFAAICYVFSSFLTESLYKV